MTAVDTVNQAESGIADSARLTLSRLPVSATIITTRHARVHTPSNIIFEGHKARLPHDLQCWPGRADAPWYRSCLGYICVKLMTIEFASGDAGQVPGPSRHRVGNERHAPPSGAPTGGSDVGRPRRLAAPEDLQHEAPTPEGVIEVLDSGTAIDPRRRMAMPLEWDFGKGDAALLLSQETRIVVSLMKVKATGEARLLIHAPPDVVVKLLDARQDGLMIKALLG